MKNKTLYTFIAGSMLAISALIFNACTDPIDTSNAPTPANGTVPVTFTIGIADEQDGYYQGEAQTSRATTQATASNQGLDAKVVRNIATRASANPDKIYKLYVLQFDQNGAWKGGKPLGDITLGTSMTMGLAELADCQLLFIALGNNNASLSTGQPLSYYQGLAADMTNCNITGFATDGSAVNNQPYILHLPHVKVTSSGIESPGMIDGKGQDVRILLKRLAAKLTLNWNFNVPGYELKEVRLSQVSGTIPNDNPNHAKGRFFFYPVRESNGNYPTAEKEYVDYYRLKDAELSTADGAYTVWMPATVRGTSSRVTAPQHRNKDNAPDGACYVEFIADKTKNGEVEDRLFYRVYLGGAAVNDFNIKENTNYTWDVTIKSANVADPRVTRLDMTPVTSKNQRNTSNCFMVIPGTDFWFNPYKHEAGTNEWNDELVNTPSGTPSIKTTITSVKVLWQSRDNGTSGELVMGRYIDANNHKNLVNSENLDNINTAKVFIKVPVSKGGNAVIAAYNDNTILWSWHLWITDYVPARINTSIGYDDYVPAQQRSQNGTVHKYRSTIWNKGGVYANVVIMDRELGAKAGGYPGFDNDNQDFTVMDAVKRAGLLYQWGRKDPFFTSADGTLTEINIIYNGDGTPLKITNLKTASLSNTIQNPLIFYTGYYAANDSWNTGTIPGKKTIYDPSPEGWKVPINGDDFNKPANLIENNGKSIYSELGAFQGEIDTPKKDRIALIGEKSYFKYARYYWDNQLYQFENTMPSANENPKGGRLFIIGDDANFDLPSTWSRNNTFWFPAAAERKPPLGGALATIATGHEWTSNSDGGTKGGAFAFTRSSVILFYFDKSYGWGVRCVQDNKD